MHDMEINNKGKPISSGTMIWGPKCKLKQRKWVNGIPCCWRTEGGESSNLVCARRYEQGFLPKELQNFAQRRYEQGFQRKELQNFEDDTNKASNGVAKIFKKIRTRLPKELQKILFLLFVGFNIQTKLNMCLLFWVIQEKGCIRKQ